MHTDQHGLERRQLSVCIRGHNKFRNLVIDQLFDTSGAAGDRGLSFGVEKGF
jgi:hypothetical protein